MLQCRFISKHKHISMDIYIDEEHMTERALEIHVTNLKIAQLIGELSRAKRKQVGCVIVDVTGRLVSSGYNGTPGSVDNCCEDANGITKEDVIHAEINAILNSKQSDLFDCVVYLTLSPCTKCAAVLLQKRVRAVIYAEEYRDRSGLDFLTKNGVKTLQVTHFDRDTIRHPLHIIAQVLELKDASLNFESEIFKTHNWDSIRHVEIIAAIEKEWNIAIKDEDIMSYKTVQDFMDLFAKVKKQTSYFVRGNVPINV